MTLDISDYRDMMFVILKTWSIFL